MKGRKMDLANWCCSRQPIAHLLWHSDEDCNWHLTMEAEEERSLLRETNFPLFSSSIPGHFNNISNVSLSFTALTFHLRTSRCSMHHVSLLSHSLFFSLLTSFNIFSEAKGPNYKLDSENPGSFFLAFPVFSSAFLFFGFPSLSCSDQQLWPEEESRATRKTRKGRVKEEWREISEGKKPVWMAKSGERAAAAGNRTEKSPSQRGDEEGKDQRNKRTKSKEEGKKTVFRRGTIKVAIVIIHNHRERDLGDSSLSQTEREEQADQLHHSSWFISEFMTFQHLDTTYDCDMRQSEKTKEEEKDPLIK